MAVCPTVGRISLFKSKFFNQPLKESPDQVVVLCLQSSHLDGPEGLPAQAWGLKIGKDNTCFAHDFGNLFGYDVYFWGAASVTLGGVWEHEL